jgi:small neutral amino acid transporter SnatA (MarC family)
MDIAVTGGLIAITIAIFVIAASQSAKKKNRTDRED